MSVGKVILLTIIFFIIYICIAGSLSLTDILLGFIASLATAIIVSDLLIKELGKAVSLRRLAALIKYIIIYLLVIEPKAHLDVARRILSPRIPINPGIVAVPYEVTTDYAITLIANSITNTPGTVVVDITREPRYFFVHWIDVKAVVPEKCREYISKRFEIHASRIFE